ncbi:geranylgeranylglycerol-phosphate geranylgeranyltransferase [Adhaeribacter rhizoryzae]|uniref:Prenyltransferase n=1 Tax=Adhaeribacter rhizoryzae TaxID=2607907 RepID=A0A5M6D1K5_9BACT|nr:geranylgeranylglycerol-phosphate geranylgeranyltransferase [Adhaeribacter rhizoryzae]KAA5539529.1 prenyltransferase [Adhaeribacter rhizoryzae]
MKKVFSLIRLPNLVIIAFCQVLVQVCLLQPQVPLLTTLQDQHFYLLLLATFCVAAAGYIINDYYDIKIDAINKPKRLVVGKGVNRRQAMVAHLLLSAIGVIVGFTLSWAVGFINIGAVLLLWGYSAQLKKMLLLGNITIAFLSATMLLVVSVNVGTDNKAIWAYALFSFIISLIREIIKDMEDVKGDATFGCRTLPIVAGIPGTKWVLYGLMLVFFATVVSAIIYRNHDLFFGLYMVVLVLVPALFFLKYIIRADRKKDFARLSNWCKGIMLLGILSMLFFR